MIFSHDITFLRNLFIPKLQDESFGVVNIKCRRGSYKLQLQKKKIVNNIHFSNVTK